MTSSSASDNLSTRLLPDLESGVSSAGETKASIRLTRLRRAIVSLAVLDFTLTVTLAVAGRQSSRHAGHGSSYNYRSTVEDLVAVSGMRALAVLAMLLSSLFLSSSAHSSTEDIDAESDRALSGEAAIAARTPVKQTRDGGWPMWIVFYAMIISSILTTGTYILRWSVQRRRKACISCQNSPTPDAGDAVHRFVKP
jgi:hypothetical protein